MKTNAMTAVHRNMTVAHNNAMLDLFTATHTAGVARHILIWMRANEIAVRALKDTGHNVEDPAAKAFASLLTLRLLDWLRPQGVPEEPTTDNVKAALARLPAASAEASPTWPQMGRK